MLKIYSSAMAASAPLLNHLLRRRLARGKEDASRLAERMGKAAKPRPEGLLVWVHAASVGEAQSALILINSLLQSYKNLHVLVTTGTMTSAGMMARNLPERAFHQFYPLDHPDWTKEFLDHWRPDVALWMESELWPNMLAQVAVRQIPAALVNARLSRKSFRRWRLIKNGACEVLRAFDLILAQTEKDAAHYRALGADSVIVTDNLKYSAHPLPADDAELARLRSHIGERPLWLYASSHAGEEDLACRVHQVLKNALPEILTIIVPRHPDRRAEIQKSCAPYKLNMTLRGDKHNPPRAETDIYLADTMGELGLFYRLAPVACIGRSFSRDGGGGHNPIEAAQLNCAVLTGPHVQYQQQLFDDLAEAGVAIQVRNERELTEQLRRLLTDSETLHALQAKGHAFALNKATVANRVLQSITPLIHKAEERGERMSA